MNCVSLSGRATNTPVGYDVKGIPMIRGVITFFSRKRGKDGRWVGKNVQYVAWGEKAVYISKNVRAGDPIELIGELDIQKFTKSDGTLGYTFQVVVDWFRDIVPSKPLPEGMEGRQVEQKLPEDGTLPW